MNFKKTSVWLVFSIVVLVWMAGCNQNNTPAQKTSVKSDNDVVALVGEKKITRGELDARLEKTYGKQVLDGYVEEQLVKMEAEKSKVKVTQQEIDSKLEKLKKRFPGEKEFEAALKNANMSKEDLAEQVRIQAFVEKAANVKVTDTEIKNYITKTPALKSTPKERIKEMLMQKKLTDWISQLKKKVTIKITFEPR